MPSLRDLQSDFADSIFTAMTPGMEQNIRPGQFPPERHLQIYRNNVFASLTNALKDVFPVVTRLVSESFLDYAANEYIRRHPPASGNLHDFGDAFPAFLADFPAAASLEYLPDVARLEWAWHRVFHAPDTTPFPFQKLKTVTPEQYGALHFVLSPAALLLESDYPILRIWEVTRPDYTDEDSVDLTAGGVRLLVVRRNRTVEIQALSAGAYAMLSGFYGGHDFARASADALACEPGFDLGATLTWHVQHETLADVFGPA